MLIRIPLPWPPATRRYSEDEEVSKTYQSRLREVLDSYLWNLPNWRRDTIDVQIEAHPPDKRVRKPIWIFQVMQHALDHAYKIDISTQQPYLLAPWPPDGKVTLSIKLKDEAAKGETNAN